MFFYEARIVLYQVFIIPSLPFPFFRLWRSLLKLYSSIMRLGWSFVGFCESSGLELVLVVLVVYRVLVIICGILVIFYEL